MLREAGRIHSQHIKQALFTLGKLHEIVPTSRSSSHFIHSSCSSPAATVFQALAVNKDHAGYVSEDGPIAHVRQALHVTSSNPTLPPPSTSRRHRSCGLAEHPGQYPSGVIDVIDEFARGTKEEITLMAKDIISSPDIRQYFRQRESARRLAQFLASTSRPSRAQSVMILAHMLGCRFKPNHFESVVHQLSLKEHWTFIAPLVSLARHQCGRTTTRLLNWKMRAFIECQCFNRLDQVLEEFARDNVQPIRRTFHLLVSGHLRNRDLNSAKRGLEMMEKAGFPVDASTHALIVTAYRSLGADPQVHALAFQALRHVDARTSTRVLNSIMQHLLDIGDERSAADYIKHLGPVATSKEAIHKLGDTITGADGVTFSPIHTSPNTSELPRIPPDAATFTILINYLAGQRHFHRVHRVLHQMVEANVKPDTGIVAALIRTYCLSGHDDMAVSLLAAMLDSEADARSLIASLRVKWVPRTPINVKGINLTVHVFNAILGRVMEIRGLGGARFIFRVMRSKGIQPNETTIEVFLESLHHTEHVTPRQLIRVLRSMSLATYGPTIRHLNIILRNVLRREKHLVYGSGWDVTASKFSPTREYKAAFPEGHILLNAENFDPSSGLARPHHLRYDSLLRPIILALSRKAVKSDRTTIAMRLKHEGIIDPTLGAAKAVFSHMIDHGMHPNRYHYTSLMDGYARAGNMRDAEHVLQSAKKAGFEPEVVMYTVLISGYGRKGKPELAMKVFRSMVSAGVAPDIPAIDALAHGYFAVGAYSVARKVLLELWPQVKPFPGELQNASLQQLARAFRRTEHPRAAGKELLTQSERSLFFSKLRGVLREWKHSQRLRVPSTFSAPSQPGH
ncbi:hypothetical protein BDN67DRAFT_49581 [Paxillus ammoniavirescens]|nr:hypothetical protein BDN67DRAFT_49581 [Paxillus ammoniavirescens]